MTFTLRSGQRFKGRLQSSGEEQFIALDVPNDHHFSLKLSAKGAWPMLSLETRSGDVLRSASAYNSKTAQTEFFDADQLGSDGLVAKVSMQAGNIGAFKLKLQDLGDLNNIRDDVIKFTNKRRLKKGLPRLKADPQLNRAAQGHAADMDRVGRYLGHQSSDGRDFQDRIDEAGYEWRSIRENVASGQRSAKAVVRSWMKSPGHRANILSDDITEIGIGFAVDDATGSTYWIQKFGAPS